LVGGEWRAAAALGRESPAISVRAGGEKNDALRSFCMARTCAICLEESADCYLRCCLRGCVATFHRECAHKALAARAQCPLCRRAVEADEVLHATDAFLELRDYCLHRYATLEATLARLIAFWTEAAAATEARRSAATGWCCWRRRPHCDAGQ
jgi:hypothetical protein